MIGREVSTSFPLMLSLRLFKSEEVPPGLWCLPFLALFIAFDCGHVYFQCCKKLLYLTLCKQPFFPAFFVIETIIDESAYWRQLFWNLWENFRKFDNIVLNARKAILLQIEQLRRKLSAQGVGRRIEGTAGPRRFPRFRNSVQNVEKSPFYHQCKRLP